MRPKLKLNLALEHRVPPRSSTAHGADSHPARSGPSGWCRLPEAGDTEFDFVIIVVVERPAPQTAIIHVPMPQINVSK
jgi:hypothetical protein